MKNAITLICLLAILVSSTGCSVGMALSGSKEPNLSRLKVGSTRFTVESELGDPDKSEENDKSSQCLYIYKTNNDPSAGRAVAHGIMDVLTCCLWELVGTPIEMASIETHKVEVKYDNNDIVTHIERTSK